MTDYHLHVLHAAMVSRERAGEAWAEAERIGAFELQAGVLDALGKIGWLVDVDDSEAEYGKTRWLLWVRDANEILEIVEGTPLGYLGLLKPTSLLPDTAQETREWLARVREERGEDPAPPAQGNILERLLETISKKEMDTCMGDPEVGDGEKILVAWAAYRNIHQAVKAGGRGYTEQQRDSMGAMVLRFVRDTLEFDKALAHHAVAEKKRDDYRALLQELGILPCGKRMEKGEEGRQN